MSTLDIEFDWVDAGPSADRSAAATMAHLAVHAGDSTFTAHVDRRRGTHAEQVTVPLQPLAEWLVAWWWAILHERAAWGGDDEPGFAERHDLAFAGAGFAYPSVLLQSTGRYLELRPRALPREHASIDYLAAAPATVRTADAEAAFTRLVEAVLARLDAQGLAGTDLEADWRALAALDPEQRAFCAVAGRFGLDPFDLEEADAAAIERLLTAVPESLHDDLLGLASPTRTESLLPLVVDAAQRAARARSGPAWRRLAGCAPRAAPTAAPWEAGFQLARWARAQLGLDGDPLDLDADREVAVVDLDPTAATPRLVAVVAPDAPTCALRPGTSDRTRRFALARAIGDHLAREVPGASLLTDLRTDRQARSRAFAAELLAPSAGLRRRLAPTAPVTPDTVDALADEFAVSSRVIEHQIANHGLGRLAG